MRFRLYDLGNQRFAKVVIRICEDVLGIGVGSFSEGPDGGIDGDFDGTAKEWPSSQAPAKGKFVIQAKHTTDPVASYSESDVSGPSASSVISKELEKIKRLVKAGRLDHYILFSNRRLTTKAKNDITNRIMTDAKPTSVGIVGSEQIERYLKKMPAVVTEMELSDIENITRFSPDALVEVIGGLAATVKAVPLAGEAIDRSGIDKKNAANDLTQRDFKATIAKSIVDFGWIRDFIGNPTNDAVKKQYEEAVAEFQIKVIDLLKEHPLLTVIRYMCDRLTEVDYELRKNKAMLRTVIHYMYWNCDIGHEGK